MIAVHCVAHRTALVASQAVVPTLKILRVMSQIFKYYHYRSAFLEAIEKLLDDPILTTNYA